MGVKMTRSFSVEAIEKVRMGMGMLKIASAVFAGIATCFPIFAADGTQTLIRDAEKFAGCMRNLDAQCSVAMLDMATMETRGTPTQDELIARAQESFDRLSSARGRYTSYTIIKPESVYSEAEGLYALVPYQFVLEFPSRGTATQRGFLVGISRDSGLTWKFVEGSQLTTGDIKVMISSYKGEALPPVYVKHADVSDKP